MAARRRPVLCLPSLGMEVPFIPFFLKSLPRAAAALVASCLVVSCATSTETPQTAATAARPSAAAADANIEVARAAFFPRISLDLVAERQNPGFQGVLTTLAGNGQSFGVGAALMQTLFDGGRRRAVRDSAVARRDELVAQYRQAIRGALLDAQRAFAVQIGRAHV